MPRRLRALPLLLLALVVSATVTACITGSRPTLGSSVPMGGDPGSATGDASVDAVLALLEGAARPAYTAQYSITRKLGPNTTTGSVVHDGAATSVTVGDVRFLLGAQPTTCSISRQTCEDGTLDARISDYSVGTGFYTMAPSRALRLAYLRRSGPPTASQQTVAGVAATCVAVPVDVGLETYCATPAGPVARWDTAGIAVELTGFQDQVDPAAFAVPGG